MSVLGHSSADPEPSAEPWPIPLRDRLPLIWRFPVWRANYLARREGVAS